MPPEECGSVKDITHRGAEHRKVSAPAHAFVPLRAVRRDGEDIGQGRPFHILHEAVQQRIVTLEIQRDSIDRGQGHTLDIFERKRAVDAFQFHELISVIGEAGLVGFLPSPGDVDILDRGAPQVLQHHLPGLSGIFRKIRIEDLGISDFHLRTGFQAPECDACHAGHILPHVIDERPLLRLFHRLGRENPILPHGKPHLGHQPERRIVVRCRPTHQSQTGGFMGNHFFQRHFAGRSPGGSSQCRIEDFPLEDAAVAIGAVIGPLPGSIGYDGFFAAICIGNYQLSKQRLAVSPIIPVLGRESDVPAPPAFTKNGVQGVFPLFESGGDIIDLVIVCLVILGKARRQIVFAHAGTVQIQVIYAASRQVGAGSGDGLVQPEFPLQLRESGPRQFHDSGLSVDGHIRDSGQRMAWHTVVLHLDAGERGRILCPESDVAKLRVSRVISSPACRIQVQVPYNLNTVHGNGRHSAGGGQFHIPGTLGSRKHIIEGHILSGITIPGNRQPVTVKCQSHGMLSG